MQLEMPSLDQVLSLIHAAEKWHLLDMEAVAINSVVVDNARQNDKRPAYLKIFVPDSWALSLRGDSDLADLFVALRIPREALLSLRREQASRKHVPAQPDSPAQAPGQDQEPEVGPPSGEPDGHK